MGHLQKAHHQNGMRTIWRQARLKCTEDATVTNPQRWNADWGSLAHWLEEEMGSGLVVTIGYSYGAGWGCQQLSHHLSMRAGMTIMVWQVLSDPVSRNRYGLGWPLNALNVTRWSGKWRRVKPPRNVTRLWYATQTAKAPHGQGVAQHSGLELEYGGHFNRGHSAMDELPEFQEAAARYIDEALARKEAQQVEAAQ